MVTLMVFLLLFLSTRCDTIFQYFSILKNTHFEKFTRPKDKLKLCILVFIRVICLARIYIDPSHAMQI